MAKVYVICDNDCKYESMTKEQIIAAIAEATGYVPTGDDNAFISQILESNGGLSLSFWLGTQAQFNALGVDAPAYNIKVDENGKVYLAPASELEIADGSVTTGKLADGSVTSDKVADGAITVSKLASGAVTLSSLGVTATASELNRMDGVTATASEINKLDGLTATTTELNYVDGVTSAIQTQLDAKMPKAGGTFSGKLYLTSGVHFGTSLPSSGSAGQIFFVKV